MFDSEVVLLAAILIATITAYDADLFVITIVSVLPDTETIVRVNHDIGTSGRIRTAFSFECACKRTTVRLVIVIEHVRPMSVQYFVC